MYRIFWQNVFKAADLQMLKNGKKLNIGQVMFSGEIYYYWPLNSSEKVYKIKLLVKHRSSLHNLLRY